MKERWAKMVLVSLLMGVVINVAVAWGLVVGVGVPTSRTPLPPQVSDEASVEWMRSVPGQWPEAAHMSIRCEWWCCCMYDLIHMELYGEVPDGERHWWMRIIAWGWPCDSVGVMWTSSEGSPLQVIFSLPDRERGVRGGLPLPAQLHRGPWVTRLPIMPMWPGFAVNTLLYGAIAGVLLFGPGVMRRWRRSRRGECVACGYNAAGLAMCPECGAAARKTAQEESSKAADQQSSK